MNSAEKETIKAHLTAEDKVLKDLEKAYKQAKKDTQQKLRNLNSRTDMQNLQSIIHQKKYQQQLMKQINGVLDDLQTNTYKYANEFFQGSYIDGYVGSMFEIQSKGVPLTIPVSPQKMRSAIQTKSKLSQTYYEKQGLTVQNIRTLKKQIALEATRGIASGKSWLETAESLTIQKCFQISQSDAMRIVRTEGNRINQQGRLDAGDEAVDAGCDLLKQWDATLDERTRPDHREADGQIVEWSEQFTVGGEKMTAPSIGGSAKQVINCRCQLLKRPRWALDEEELEALKKRAEYYGLDKSKSFEDYKQKYLKLPDNAQTVPKIPVDLGILDKPVKSADPNYDLLLTSARQRGIDYNPVANRETPLSDNDIINLLSGGDRTQGSCASVGLAYIGQKEGWDVYDFRDGDSQKFFSNGLNLWKLSQAEGMKVLKADGACSLTVGNRLLKQCEEGKEYYLCVGKHATIVRKTANGLQYLELQSSRENGWMNFDGNARNTLNWRFGCTKTSDGGHSSKRDFMINIDDSDFNNDSFKSLLGYLNTGQDKQKKGKDGQIK